jgi:hypothetical protein
MRMQTSDADSCSFSSEDAKSRVDLLARDQSCAYNKWPTVFTVGHLLWCG